MNTNLIIITGNLPRNAETKTTTNGKTVLSFSVGNNCGFGEHKKTYWFRCNYFGDTAAKKPRRNLIKQINLSLTTTAKCRFEVKHGR